MITKLQILDEIIKTEDEIELSVESEVRKKVTDRIKEKYGDFGLNVVNLYYKDSDGDLDNSDCPECEENAKKFVEAMNLASKISSSILDTSTKNYYSLIDYKCGINSMINELISTIKSKMKIDFNSKYDDLMICKSLIKSLTKRMEET